MERDDPESFAQTIVYVAPDCTDSAVKKRAHGFLGLGHSLTSFSFRRARYNVDVQPAWPNVELGHTTERKLVARIAACFRALAVIYRHRKQWRAATILYVRNLDLAALALVGKAITGARAEFVYEILDIHPALGASGWRATILRWLERRVLQRSRLLVVSSPAFSRSYFRAVQGYSGPTYLLENKWPRDALPPEPRKLPYALSENEPVWNIGWFGNLRCRQSLDLLTELADAMPRRVQITMRGCASLLDEHYLRKKIAGRANMVYLGAYQAPEDFPSVYKDIHFNWCADFGDGKNSAWLLPNRLYEGGYFGVPALAVATQETGRVVQERQLGFALATPILEHLREMLTQLTVDDYRALRKRLERRPASDFVDSGELAQLVHTVLCPSPPRAADDPATPLVAR